MAKNGEKSASALSFRSHFTHTNVMEFKISAMNVNQLK
jgi:hypothetical protein